MILQWIFHIILKNCLHSFMNNVQIIRVQIKEIPLYMECKILETSD